MNRRNNKTKPLPKSIQYAIISELRVMTIYNPGAYDVVLIV